MIVHFMPSSMSPLSPLSPQSTPVEQTLQASFAEDSDLTKLSLSLAGSSQGQCIMTLGQLCLSALGMDSERTQRTGKKARRLP